MRKAIKALYIASGVIPAIAALYLTLKNPAEKVTINQVLTNPSIANTLQMDNKPVQRYNSRVKQLKKANDAVKDGYISEKELFGKTDWEKDWRLNDRSPYNDMVAYNDSLLFDWVDKYGTEAKPVNNKDTYVFKLKDLLNEAQQNIRAKKTYTQNKMNALQDLLEMRKNPTLTAEETGMIEEKIKQQSLIFKEYGLTSESKLGREVMQCVRDYARFLEEQKTNGWLYAEAEKLAKQKNSSVSFEKIAAPICATPFSGLLGFLLTFLAVDAIKKKKIGVK